MQSSGTGPAPSYNSPYMQSPQSLNDQRYNGQLGSYAQLESTPTSVQNSSTPENGQIHNEVILSESPGVVANHVDYRLADTSNAKTPVNVHTQTGQFRLNLLLANRQYESLTVIQLRAEIHRRCLRMKVSKASKAYLITWLRENDDKARKDDGKGREDGAQGRDDNTRGREDDAQGRKDGAQGREDGAQGVVRTPLANAQPSRVETALANKQYERLTIVQLMAEAKRRGVSFNTRFPKAKIITLLRKDDTEREGRTASANAEQSEAASGSDTRDTRSATLQQAEGDKVSDSPLTADTLSMNNSNQQARRHSF